MASMRTSWWAPLGAVLWLASTAAAEPVRVVDGGPAKKAARGQVVAALSRLAGDVEVCFRRAGADPVEVELAVAASGAVTRSTQRGKGAVAQCVAGVLAVQQLPPCGVYTLVVEWSPGGDPMAAVKEELLPHRDALQRCYDQAAGRRPGRAGEVELGFLIRPDGRIVDAEVRRSTLADPAVEGCLVDAIQRARLAERPGGRTISFAMALSFAPGGAGAGAASPAAGALQPSKDGPVSAEVLTQVMNENKARFAACYDQHARREPKLAGRVVLRYTIRGDGTVHNVQIKESTLHHEKVEACVVGVGQSLRFPGEPGRDKTRVVYPFEFSQP
jgi:TonB family protein